MDYKEILRKQIPSLPIYQPGKPIDLFAREMGIDPRKVIKLASNENPLGASPSALENVRKHLHEAWLYPDNAGYHLVEKIGEKFDFKFEEVVLSAGSNEIFYQLCDLFVEPGRETIMGSQSFVTYRIATQLAGGKAVFVPMPNFEHDLEGMLAAINDKTRVVFLPNPNNPTGTMVPAEAVLDFAERLPDHVIFCYDEAYREYESRPVDLTPLMRAGRKIVATRTFSKIYGLASFRIGYGYGEVELIRLLNQVRAPFNTGGLSQVAAIGALDDDAFVKKSIVQNELGMKQLEAGFARLGLEWVPSYANFILVRFENPSKVHQLLTENGIIVRPVAGYDLPEHLRITVGTEPQNARLLEVLNQTQN